MLFKFKKFFKDKVESFGFRIINLKSQKKNYKNFSQYETFKKAIKLTKDKKIIIFDVGTNVGQYLDLYKKVLNDLSISNYEIHCFEPNTTLIKDLEKYRNNNIIINNLAVCDVVGEREFLLQNSSEKSSFYEYRNMKHKNQIKVKTMTLDKYCKDKKLDKINFLKIDTEGAEPEVLNGCESLIKNNKIDWIFSELSIGKLFNDLDLSLSSLEKFMFGKFQLVGVGLNRDYYQNKSDSEFLNIIHCLDHPYMVFSQQFLYINKKIIENKEKK